MCLWSPTTMKINLVYENNGKQVNAEWGCVFWNHHDLWHTVIQKNFFINSVESHIKYILGIRYLIWRSIPCQLKFNGLDVVNDILWVFHYSKHTLVYLRFSWYIHASLKVNSLISLCRSSQPIHPAPVGDPTIQLAKGKTSNQGDQEKHY